MGWGIQKEKMIGKNVKVLETMRISNSKYIQILKIGNKCFAIAVCKDTVTYLCEVNEEELIYRKIQREEFTLIISRQY